MAPSTPARRAYSAWEPIVVSAFRAAAWASARSRGSTVSWRRFLLLVVHKLRAGQGPQSLAAKVATAAAWPLWVHGVHDEEVLPCGQVSASSGPISATPQVVSAATMMAALRYPES